jgi:hypothetical protein
MKRRKKHSPTKRNDRLLSGLTICYKDSHPRDISPEATELCERWLEHTNPHVTPYTITVMYETNRKMLIERKKHWQANIKLAFHDSKTGEYYGFTEFMNLDEFIVFVNKKIDGLKMQSTLEKPNSILKYIEIKFIVL